MLPLDFDCMLIEEKVFIFTILYLHARILKLLSIKMSPRDKLVNKNKNKIVKSSSKCSSIRMSKLSHCLPRLASY